MNLPMELLRTYVTVAELGGFTSAGGILGRSQPAISLQVKRLEDLLGMPLFKRDNRRLGLTEEGEVLLEYAQRILGLNDEAISRLIKPKIAGFVRLGIPNEFASSFLPGILGKFAQSHPQVQLEVRCDLSTNLLGKMQEDEFDLVVALHENPDSKSGIRVWTEDLVWVASLPRNHPTEEPLPLIVAPQGCVYRNEMIHTLSKAKKSWRIVYTSPNYGGIKAGVLAGLGVTVLAKSTVPEGVRILGAADKLPPLGKVEVRLHYDRENASEAALRLADYITSSVGHAPQPALAHPPRIPAKRLAIVD